MRRPSAFLKGTFVLACGFLSACTTLKTAEPLRLTREEPFEREAIVRDLLTCLEGVLADTQSPQVPRFASQGCGRLASDPYIKDNLLPTVTRGFERLPEDEREQCRDTLTAVARQAGTQITGTDVWFEKPWVRVEDWQSLENDELLLFVLAHTEQAVTGMALARIEEGDQCRPLMMLPSTFVRAYALAQSRAFKWPDRVVERDLTPGLEWEVWTTHLYADLRPGEQLKASGLYHVLDARGKPMVESDTATPLINSLHPPRD
ncbi:MAG: hypothetical protein V2I43_27205 [Parvularcula sp.]|jgi:hypothetical protein|nr:hypothetical protein [Parvularcula sp.]